VWGYLGSRIGYPRALPLCHMTSSWPLQTTSYTLLTHKPTTADSTVKTCAAGTPKTAKPVLGPR
jgi:hypothetical protein